MDLAEGDEVRLVDIQGTTTKGRFVSMSEDSMSVLVNGSRREVLEASVREVRRQRPDSPWTGALIGLGAGVGATIVAVHSTCSLPDPECEAIAGAVFGTAFAGGGLIVGGIIDYFVHGYDTVFEPPTSSRNRGFEISPIIGSRQKGARMGFSF